MVWERLEEIKKEQAQAEARRLEQERADRLRRSLEEMNRAKERARIENEAHERKLRIIREGLVESGVLEGMRELERGLHGQVRKHAIVVDMEYGSATLAWGNKFEVVGNEITYQASPFLDEVFHGIEGEMDYSSVHVSVNTDDESLSIGSRQNTIPKDQWAGNRAVVVDALARAYLDPSRRIDVKRRPPRHSDTSSSGSSTTECCHS